MRAQQDSLQLLGMQRETPSCEYHTSYRPSDVVAVTVQFRWIHGDFVNVWYPQEESQVVDKGIYPWKSNAGSCRIRLLIGVVLLGDTSSYWARQRHIVMTRSRFSRGHRPVNMVMSLHGETMGGAGGRL